MKLYLRSLGYSSDAVVIARLSASRGQHSVLNVQELQNGTPANFLELARSFVLRFLRTNSTTMDEPVVSFMAEVAQSSILTDLALLERECVVEGAFVAL